MLTALEPATLVSPSREAKNRIRGPVYGEMNRRPEDERALRSEEAPLPRRPRDRERMRGKVYFVGAGPGAPDLITVRGARLLAQAHIVFHDALVHPDILALAPQAKIVNVGKRHNGAAVDQRFIHRSLAQAARRCAVVVRLKGGDPTLFGRLQEEIEALESQGIPYEVVPGVTAATAAAAALGVSLTRRGSGRSVALVTPRVGRGETPTDWAAGAAAADTLAIYMGASQASQVAATLIAQGKPAATPVALVENATLDGERHLLTTLGALLEGIPLETQGPVLILAGRAAEALAARALQTETLPLPLLLSH